MIRVARATLYLEMFYESTIRETVQKHEYDNSLSISVRIRLQTVLVAFTNLSYLFSHRSF
jgi:hypothetical protein